MNDRFRGDRFTQDTNFEHFLDFYFFDKELLWKVSDTLERIEIGIRAIIIEILGGHGSHVHRDTRSYDAWFTDPDVKIDESQMSKLLTGQDPALLKSKEKFAKHFRIIYSGQPPIWIAAGSWDRGNLSDILSGLSDKNKISVCAESLTQKSAAEDQRRIFVDPAGAGRGQYRDIGKISDTPGGEKTRRADPSDFWVRL